MAATVELSDAQLKRTIVRLRELREELRAGDERIRAGTARLQATLAAFERQEPPRRPQLKLVVTGEDEDRLA